MSNETKQAAIYASALSFTVLCGMVIYFTYAGATTIEAIKAGYVQGTVPGQYGVYWIKSEKQ